MPNGQLLSHAVLSPSGLKLFAKSDSLNGPNFTISWTRYIGCRISQRGGQTVLQLQYLRSQAKHGGSVVNDYSSETLSHLQVVLEKATAYLKVSDNDSASALQEEFQRWKQKQNELLNLKPYLVFINPKGGPGKARSNFYNQVAPLFDETRVPYEVFETLSRGYLEETLSKMSANQLLKYRAIVVISGDGLINEVVNGLALRSDWPHGAAAQIPIGVLPGGGGNATASSICYKSGFSTTKNLLLHSTYILLLKPPLSSLPQPIQPLSLCDEVGEHFTSCMHEQSKEPNSQADRQELTRLDAIFVEAGRERVRRVGVVNIEWGLLADIDFCSERFRRLGSTRFAAAAALLIIKRPVYYATLSYLPAGSRQTWGPDVYLPRNETSRSHYRNLRDISPPISPLKTATKVLTNEQMQSEESWRKQDLSSEEQQRNNSKLTKPKIHFDKENEHRCKSNIVSSLPESAHQWRYLPDLTQPVPDGWITRREAFSTIFATKQSHIASDALLLPDAKFDDGCMYLIIIKASATRMDLVRLSNRFTSGKGIVTTPHMDVIRVRAFRIVPENETGVRSMIDGEPLHTGPIQAEIATSQFSLLTGFDQVPSTRCNHSAGVSRRPSSKSGFRRMSCPSLSRGTCISNTHLAQYVRGTTAQNPTKSYQTGSHRSL